MSTIFKRLSLKSYQIYSIINQINTKRDKILKHPKIVHHFLEQSNVFWTIFWISHHSVGIDSFGGIVFNSILAKITNFLYLQTTSQENSEKSDKNRRIIHFLGRAIFSSDFWDFPVQMTQRHCRFAANNSLSIDGFTLGSMFYILHSVTNPPLYSKIFKSKATISPP